MQGGPATAILYPPKNQNTHTTLQNQNQIIGGEGCWQLRGPSLLIIGRPESYLSTPTLDLCKIFLREKVAVDRVER